MNNTIPELCRKKAVESLFSTATMRNAWAVWKPKIREILGENPSHSDILNLGDRLGEIFTTTGEAGRSQSSVSGGGTAWESLVCWYINLCTAGSRIVAFRKMSEVPKPIQNAITVNYGNFACNTESDITVVIFPDIQEYTTDIDDLNVLNDEGEAFQLIRKSQLNMNVVNFLCERDFPNYEIGVIQCKTNWNDNAQIPMLWDMIYSANGFRGRNITIGREGYNIHDTNNFSYAFVTVPSNKNQKYKQDSVAVKRVTNLSGGNYWGKDSEMNVARSLKEIFNNNYSNGFASSLREDIRNSMLHHNAALSYFDII